MIERKLEDATIVVTSDWMERIEGVEVTLYEENGIVMGLDIAVSQAFRSTPFMNPHTAGSLRVKA